MVLPEQIKTTEGFTEAKLKEKGSLFHSLVYFAETKEKAEEILSKLRNQYYDATHHCFAYKFKDGSVKYSDDGEPSGTAGVRILKAIEHFDLTDTIVITIRYFGGTKLGVGPLGKAYYDSAHEALSQSPIIIKNAYRFIKISFSEEFTNPVYHQAGLFELKIKESGYKEKNYILGYVEDNRLVQLSALLKNLTKGEVTVEIMGEIEYLAV
ncbi:MAG: YigZ family protein [Ignavibacteriaceae bacterium]